MAVRCSDPRRFGPGAVRVRCGYGTGTVRYVNVFLLPTVAQINAFVELPCRALAVGVHQYGGRRHVHRSVTSSAKGL